MVITMMCQHLTYEDIEQGINKDIRHQSNKYLAFAFMALAALLASTSSTVVADTATTSELETSETVIAEAPIYAGTYSNIPVDAADIKAVQRVIGGQIYALKSGNHQAAYSYAAPNVKQAFPSVKNFISMVQNGYKPLYQHISYIFGKNTASNGEVYQEVIVADETRQLWQFIYTLKQQDDFRWKVTNVVMYPYKGTSV